MSISSRNRSDPELIAASHRGDRAAYDELFRRHEPAVRRLARLVAGRKEVEELILHAYTEALQALDTGDGPRVAFRTYALVSLLAGAGGGTENSPVAAYGYEAMPEEWQAALWHTEVERDNPAEAGGILGLTATEVVGLSGQARAGIRRYAATVYLAGVEAPRCRAAIEHLVAFLGGEGGPDRSQTIQLRSHLDRCERCETVRLRLSALDERLGLVLAQAVLRGYGPGYLEGVDARATRLPAHVRLRRLIAGSSRGLAATAVVSALALALTAWGLLSYAGSAGPIPRSGEPVPRRSSESGRPVDGPVVPGSPVPLRTDSLRTDSLRTDSLRTELQYSEPPHTAPPGGPRGHWLTRTTGRSRIIDPHEAEPRDRPVWLIPARTAGGPTAPESHHSPGSPDTTGLRSRAPERSSPRPPVPPARTPTGAREHPPGPPEHLWTPPAGRRGKPGPGQAPDTDENSGHRSPHEYWKSDPTGRSSTQTWSEKRTRTIYPEPDRAENPGVEQAPEHNRGVTPWAPTQLYRRAMPWNWLGGGGHSGSGAPDTVPGTGGAAAAFPAGAVPGGAAQGGAAVTEAATGSGTAVDGEATPSQRGSDPPALRGSGHQRPLHAGPGLGFGRHFSGFRY